MGTLAFHCDFFLLCLRSSQRSSCLAMWADTLLILFISICTALLGEGVTWVLVYRTEKYQKLKSEIEKQSKKLEKKKEAHGESANLDRSKKRKLEAAQLKKTPCNRNSSLFRSTG